jgi:two-component sensor histidine kinase
MERPKHHSGLDAVQNLHRVRQHQTILVEFARVAAEATNQERLLNVACEHAARATGVKHSKVLQFRSDKSDLLIIAGKGWKPGVVGHARLGADMMSPPGRAYQTRACVTVADLSDDVEFRASAILREHGIRSLLNAPIGVDGVVWGIVEVDSDAPNAFNQDDEHFLVAFALILALAIRQRQAQSERDQNAEELGKRLFQAETMMQEQNHRVRNYFQMILGLLASRSRRSASEQGRSELRDIMERVSAVGLAHDLLTVKSGESIVNVAQYIEALCAGLERTVSEGLTIERDLEALDLRPDRAVPLGLIVNELVTNCYKYGRKNDAAVSVAVIFRSDTGTSEALLSVEDNGPGIQGDSAEGTGLGLIRSLAGQLSGRVSVSSSEKGTKVELRLPLI